MGKRHVKVLLLSAFLLVAVVIAGATFPDQAYGQTNGAGTDKVGPADSGAGTGSQGSPSNQGTQGQGSQGTQGPQSVPGTQPAPGTPGTMDEYGVDATGQRLPGSPVEPQRAEGTPWGVAITSFLVGLIVGGLLFRNRSRVVTTTGRRDIDVDREIDRDIQRDIDRDIDRDDHRRAA